VGEPPAPVLPPPEVLEEPLVLVLVLPLVLVLVLLDDEEVLTVPDVDEPVTPAEEWVEVAAEVEVVVDELEPHATALATVTTKEPRNTE